MRQLEELSPQDKALQQLDADYQRYRQSVEFAFKMAQELVNRALDPVVSELASVRNVLQDLQTTIQVEKQEQSNLVDTLGETTTSLAAEEDSETAETMEAPRRGRRKKVVEPVKVKPNRIRWGSTEEEIKNTIFEQLRLLEEHGKEITVTNIKEDVPSMMRFLYGKDALFQGINALIEEYEQIKKGATEIPEEIKETEPAFPDVEPEVIPETTETEEIGVGEETAE
ncbi:hypothetical protein H1S01_03535 [Heliobacterium chlorum]|uniref:Uncharacterized protein n=1 Tax=Heliobacterium chlorum TaxID=2698 RepID=A0ABR7SZZ9_HELCL|nr:hypothetical protein [Heliobacterium chlorum]MBC9783585.1 hypothetical protein [Heliobacterium chlorum]